MVVTCTDRKVAAPQEALRVRSLPADDLAARAAAWVTRLAASKERFPLERLYQGDHWTRAVGLSAVAERAGFAPRLWVASAGLGLRPVSDSAPSYGATFSPRHADTVAATSAGTRQWWAHLQASVGATTLCNLGAAGPVIMVLSEVYSNGLAAEVKSLAALGGEVLLVGGAEDLPGVHRLPANAALRKPLGGTLTSLNARTAAAWLGHCTKGELLSVETQRLWEKWTQSAAQPERFSRTPLSDEQVVNFITTQHNLTPEYSRTKMHRLLRDGGMACEQKRFAQLHAQTLGDR